MLSPANVALRAIWGTGPSNVIAVGELESVLRYDGTAWKLVNGRDTQDALTFTDVAGSRPDNIYVLANEGFFHYTGPIE